MELKKLYKRKENILLNARKFKSCERKYNSCMKLSNKNYTPWVVNPLLQITPQG